MGVSSGRAATAAPDRGQGVGVHEVLAVLLVKRLQPFGVGAEGIEQDGEVVVVALVGLDGPAGGGCASAPSR